MKVPFYTARDLVIEGKDIKAGALIATVETPDGVPLDRALNAIAKGMATQDAPARAEEVK